MDSQLTFWRISKVKEITGYSKSTLYRLIEQRKFPRPVKLNDGYSASAWVESEVRSWMASRIAASRDRQSVGRRIAPGTTQ